MICRLAASSFLPAQTMPKILIIVPAYNEEDSLPGVLSDLQEHFPEGDVLVIDDGSRDRTAEISRAAGVDVVRLPFNLGIGGAVQTGYRYAQRNGYDIAVQFDGDGQHVAAEIAALIAPVLGGRADIVVGSRFLEAGAYRPPVFRRIGIWLFSRILSLIIGYPVTDTTSGFRAVNARVIAFFAVLYPEDYPEVESLVLLHRAGMRIEEIAARMRVRRGGTSSITPVRSAYYMVKVLLAVFIDLLKK
jgi:glycosyltransferase involved in cell wall biosynthesis